MRISFSAMSKYKECPYSYFLHYFRKVRSVDNKSSFAFGSAIDEALNKLLTTKDLDEAIYEFGLKWHEVKGQNIVYTKADLEEHLLTKEQLGLSKQEQSWHSLMHKGKIFLTEFNAQIMPQIKKVIAVQVEEYIKNSTGDELQIKADFICEWKDGRILLVDNKTSSVKYADDSVETSEQLATYFDPLQERFGLTACAYVVIPKKTNKKKLPPVQIDVIIGEVKEETIEATFKTFETVMNGIKEAKFERNWNNCLNKYGKCVYYNLCHNNDMTGLVEKIEIKK